VTVDSAGTARLYIGLGKRDGVWPKDIAEVVKKLTGLPDRSIDAIEVLERFSFVSVPFDAAEKAIAEARKNRGAPFMRIAAPKGGPGKPGGFPRKQGERAPYPKRGSKPFPDGPRRKPGFYK
ncbi:MAG: DbpA RNA binding domain-containing protein, partial [Spirochaetota bacterium]